MSAWTNLETWVEDFSSEAGNGGIIFGLANSGLDIVSFCEDLANYVSSGKSADAKLVLNDIYKFAIDFNGVIKDVQKSDAPIAKILGKALAAFAIESDLNDILLKYSSGNAFSGGGRNFCGNW